MKGKLDSAPFWVTGAVWFNLTGYLAYHLNANYMPLAYAVLGACLFFFIKLNFLCHVYGIEKGRGRRMAVGLAAAAVGSLTCTRLASLLDVFFFS